MQVRAGRLKGQHQPRPEALFFERIMTIRILFWHATIDPTRENCHPYQHNPTLPVAFRKKVVPTLRSGPHPRDALEMGLCFITGQCPPIFICLPDGKQLRLAAGLRQCLVQRVHTIVLVVHSVYTLISANNGLLFCRPFSALAPRRVDKHITSCKIAVLSVLTIAGLRKSASFS